MHKIPGDDEEKWGAVHLDRMKSMVERDKTIRVLLCGRWAMNLAREKFPNLIRLDQSARCHPACPLLQFRGDGNADYSDTRSRPIRL